MINLDNLGTRVIFSVALIVGLLNMPIPAYSQDETNLQDLIQNGGFEAGFQEGLGLGYGWGAFSNGNAAVGWSADSWDKVVVSGQHSHSIEIKNATEQNRYAGIYQTVSVVPGQQYKLTIKGLIRSNEGDIERSDYGYRLQYGIDYDGGTAWELLSGDDWVELPWDEQPLSEPENGTYRVDTFETTITAKSDELTLFIRGWKKWINTGSGIFNLDAISLVGPAPENAQVPSAQVAAVEEPASSAEGELVSNEPSLQTEHDEDLPVESSESDEMTSPAEGETVPEPDSSTEPEVAPEPESSTPAESEAATQPEPDVPAAENSQLPVSGQGNDDSISYIIMSGAALLLVLFVGAVSATKRQRGSVD